MKVLPTLLLLSGVLALAGCSTQRIAQASAKPKQELTPRSNYFHGLWVEVAPRQSYENDELKQAQYALPNSRSGHYKRYDANGSFTNYIAFSPVHLFYSHYGTYRQDKEGNIIQERILGHTAEPKMVGQSSKIQTKIIDQDHFLLTYETPDGIVGRELMRRVKFVDRPEEYYLKELVAKGFFKEKTSPSK